MYVLYTISTGWLSSCIGYYSIKYHCLMRIMTEFITFWAAFQKQTKKSIPHLLLLKDEQLEQSNLFENLFHSFDFYYMITKPKKNICQQNENGLKW